MLHLSPAFVQVKPATLSVSDSVETFIRKDADFENKASTDGRDWGDLVT